jgi:hypothetical protein
MQNFHFWKINSKEITAKVANKKPDKPAFNKGKILVYLA